MNAKVASNVTAELGEGPSWDARTGILYWVDIKGGRIYAHKPGNESDDIVASTKGVSSVVPRAGGGFALTSRHGFYSLDLKTGRIEPLTEEVEIDLESNKFNDGKCDPAGRYWAGTMDQTEKSPSGSLYLLEKGSKLKKVLSNITVSNGLGWSPDHKTMYYIDSPTKKVRSFDYSLPTGEISNQQVAVDFVRSGQIGDPDGMAVDNEGMIWVAHWGGGRVTRWNPSKGVLLDTLQIPADQVTSVCFAGENLDELYITTARDGLDEKTLASKPLAGSLFVSNVGVRGLPTYPFEG
jgi:sugar lactone lactonase YvrE